jgi:amino acid transporter
VLLYSFVGVELPSTAGEEIRDPRRDIPVAIARAGAWLIAILATGWSLLVIACTVFHLTSRRPT